MKAILLGAGYGTRLYPLTKDRPKPLLPVGGKPILERILDKLLTIEELDECYVVSNGKYFERYGHWLKGYRSECPIRLVNNRTQTPEERLGAVGDIQFVIEEAEIHDDLLIVAGDNLLEFDLLEFADFFRSKGPAVGLKDMAGSSLINKYSVVELNEEGRIVDFDEKPARPRTTLIAICLYLFPASELDRIRQYLQEQHNPDAPGYYIQWLYRLVPLYGYIIRGPWFDIGDIDSYNMANELYGVK